MSGGSAAPSKRKPYPAAAPPPDKEAEAIDWKPCRKGGSSFRTHNLIERDPDRLETVQSQALRLFALAFLIPGLITSGLGIYGLFARNWEEGFLLLCGLVFTGGGLACWHIGRHPAVFDRQRRAFWRDRRNPEKLGDPAELKPKLFMKSQK